MRELNTLSSDFYTISSIYFFFSDSIIKKKIRSIVRGETVFQTKSEIFCSKYAHISPTCPLQGRLDLNQIRNFQDIIKIFLIFFLVNCGPCDFVESAYTTTGFYVRERPLMMSLIMRGWG